MPGRLVSPNNRVFSWFGKLPCIGDFCSHNMPSPLLNSMDTWLSTTLQQAEEKHGTAWIEAYFQAPIHGFLLGGKSLATLGRHGAVGVIMPSVDKAGRAFPFVLLEQLADQWLENQNFDDSLQWRSHKMVPYLPPCISQWFWEAHALCASALAEDWSLEQLGSALIKTMPPTVPQSTVSTPNLSLAGSANDHFSHWYRIDFSGSIQKVHQCTGLPDLHAFETLLGLNSAP